MLKKKSTKNGFENVNILEKAQIIYFDETIAIFEAVHIVDTGVYTGRIAHQNEFIDCGFIPKQSIKKIKGGNKRKLYKMKSKKF
jgi:hypothetical protein